MENPYIDFDILKVKSLKDEYEENMGFITEALPTGINFNSPKQIRALLEERLDITTKHVRISELEVWRDFYDHDSEGFDLLNGLVLYLKCKFILSNYINCILKHEENGRVYLRFENGEWLMPNKRPLSDSPQIIACISGKFVPVRYQ